MSTLNQCNGSCSTLLTGMRTKFEREELTDVTVRYGANGEHTKRAHRLVLCAASDFFDNMLHKHCCKENKEGVITLAIEDKDVVEVVLGCIYGADYTDEGRGQHALFFDIAVYAAADYCDLPHLRHLAARKFKLAAAPIFGSPSGCQLFINAIKKAYEETSPHDRMLRPLIASLCVWNKEKLFAHPGLKSALQENAELSTDISFAFANNVMAADFSHEASRSQQSIFGEASGW